MASSQPSRALVVTREAQVEEQIIGLEVLLGRYEQSAGLQHDGQPVFVKVQENKSRTVYLYYCGPSHGKDSEGWWFGDEVGGTKAWSHAWSNQGFPPPTSDWVVPVEGSPPLPSLRVKEAASKEQEEEIQRLIDERNAHRKAREYTKADKIRELLKQKGVVIADHKSEDGRFVSTTWEYEATAGASTATSQEKSIEDLVEERTQCRKRKDFARADQIRDSLREQGVVLSDTRRPDGRHESTTWKYQDKEQEGAEDETAKKRRLEQAMEEQKRNLEKEIEELVKQRDQHRRNRDYVKADNVRDTLRKMGVVLLEGKKGDGSTSWRWVVESK
eukprot:TRINITY_DN104953_c0_g1_i1.p1 TRINITY_DN104953_c0_g1~~TRINITY_DN104953_c0_g1_i1.p1  ORF type:complete len:330 (-),score=73.00 TRINITY_DN104953_c0_g1_i1:47-1036(-)